MNITTAKAKELVRNYTVSINGYNRLADIDVKVVNVRVRKSKIVADLIHYDYSENSQMRYNNVDFTDKELKEWQKKIAA